MAILLDTITLPSELIWQDEFAWSMVSSRVTYTINGKPLIEQAKLASESGRPITLSGTGAWITYADALIIRGWSNTTNKIMALTLHDDSIKRVMFRHWEKPVMEFIPVMGYADMESTDVGTIVLKLVIV